jgi:hypothetical protein
MMQVHLRRLSNKETSGVKRAAARVKATRVNSPGGFFLLSCPVEEGPRQVPPCLLIPTPSCFIVNNVHYLAMKIVCEAMLKTLLLK